MFISLARKREHANQKIILAIIQDALPCKIENMFRRFAKIGSRDTLFVAKLIVELAFEHAQIIFKLCRA